MIDDITTNKQKDKILKYLLNEDYLRLYLYRQYDFEDYFDRGNVKFSISPGVSWIAQVATSVYSSIQSEYATTFSDTYSLFFLRMESSFFRETTYIDRKILEKTAKYEDSNTSYTDPVYGIMTSVKYLVNFGDH